MERAASSIRGKTWRCINLPNHLWICRKISSILCRCYRGNYCRIIFVHSIHRHLSRKHSQCSKTVLSCLLPFFSGDYWHFLFKSWQWEDNCSVSTTIHVSGYYRDMILLASKWESTRVLHRTVPITALWLEEQLIFTTEKRVFLPIRFLQMHGQSFFSIDSSAMDVHVWLISLLF